jgi:glycerol-3-phosphate acyltransferase PlsX
MKIGIDMMGGDFAPLEAIKGIQQYVQQKEQRAHLVLLGDAEQISSLAAEYALPAEEYTIVHAPQVIGMHEHPTRALKEKQKSSIAVGFYLLAKVKLMPL